MTRRLTSWVHVPDENGVMKAFGPDDVVPDWAAAQITNPKAWAVEEEAGGETPADPDAPKEDQPPKTGKGSGQAAWLSYAESIGVEVPEGASRDEIIELVESQ